MYFSQICINEIEKFGIKKNYKPTFLSFYILPKDTIF